MGDWIFTVLTWLLLTLGLVTLAWALCYDRSRGRKRCPKCWYDMVGIEPDESTNARTCPECGRVTIKERKFRKTRRRWGFATLALFVLAGSYASYAYPIVRDHGWWRLAPDLALIALLPHIERFGEFPEGQYPDNDLYTELYYHRSTTNPSSKHHPWWTRGELWPWERWLLKHQSLKLLRSTSNHRVKQVAARLLAATTRHPVPLVAEEDKGYAAIAQAIHAYENCETYIDYGVFFKPQGFGRYTLFATAYERDGRFHQESRYRVTPGAPNWSHRVAWVDSAKTSRRWDTHNRQVDTTPQIFGAVQFLDMFQALMPTESFFSPLQNVYDTSLFGRLEIRGRNCYHVKGRDSIGRDLWFCIEASTGLVIRFSKNGMTADFEPTFDTAIAPDWWSFDPGNLEASPLMQRLDNINDVLPDTDLLAEPPPSRR